MAYVPQHGDWREHRNIRQCVEGWHSLFIKPSPPGKVDHGVCAMYTLSSLKRNACNFHLLCMIFHLRNYSYTGTIMCLLQMRCMCGLQCSGNARPREWRIAGTNTPIRDRYFIHLRLVPRKTYHWLAESIHAQLASPSSKATFYV